jgi:hypothetical protein
VTLGRLMRVQLVLLALVAAAGASVASGAASNEAVFRPAERPLGQPYGEWVVRWTRWSLVSPKAQAPQNNVERCSTLPQPFAPIRFVPPIVEPGKVTVRCSFPQRSIVVIRTAARTCLADAGENDATVRARCRGEAIARFPYFDTRIDGQLLRNIRRDLIVTRVASAQLPEDNVLDVPAGRIRGVVAGWFLILRPLPPGLHVIRQLVRLDDGGVIEKTYRIRITR